MVYLGGDLHRKVSQVAAVQANGEVLWNRRIRSAPAGVAFEATYGWGWFADLLADLGLPAYMSHPKGTKAITSARVKKQCGRRRDARPAVTDQPAARSLDCPSGVSGGSAAGPEPRRARSGAIPV